MSKITRTVAPGDRFGRGVVTGEIRIPSAKANRPPGYTERGARLLCDCGRTYEARVSDLVRKDQDVTKSCGCWRQERMTTYASSPDNEANLIAATAASTTHGLSGHPLYKTWSNMMARCYIPERIDFKNYGSRGITVWQPWHDAAVFIADILRLIGPRPDGMTLDRIDNNGPYTPWNVRWATWAEQNRNTRRQASQHH